MASHHQNKSNSGFVPRRSNPTTIRSSSGGGSTSSHLYGSGRPRSLSLYSPSSSPSSASNSGSYGGHLGLHSNFGGYGNDTSYLGSHSGYSSPRSYGSSSSVSSYGGTASGYGGLTLHHAPSSSSLGLSASPRSSYYNSFLQTPVNHVHSGSGSSSNSRTPSRSGSFNRTLTGSRSSPLSSTLGSRTGSLTSLASSTRSGSEGYSSGGDLSSHSSRLSSVSFPAGGDNRSGTPAKDGSENGEVDYKKLYEESMVVNERLREKLKKTEQDLTDRKSQLDKLSVATAKNSFTELEKRERRAMERKLSEMEEELKQLQKLKAENERLKAENRALTRVVSKLTNSANATK